MTDIVERLRSAPVDNRPATLLNEAADEIERLRKYEKLVQYIASDYWELSYDKIRWLYTEYKTKSRKLIEEDQ